MNEQNVRLSLGEGHVGVCVSVPLNVLQHQHLLLRHVTCSFVFYSYRIDKIQWF